MPRSFQPAEIRKQLRTARREIPGAYRTQASYRFSEQVAELDCYRSAQTIGAFVPFDGEADPLPLMDRAILENKSVWVPIIVGKSKPLAFARWSREIETRPNRFGIAEPVFKESELAAGNEIDCVITPLVAFDERCRRIGVGGGFYDRTFAFLKNSPDHKTKLVGVAFEMQKLDTIKPQPHDVQLDYVITELGIYAKA